MRVSEGIEYYLWRKRATGFRYQTEEATLAEFRRHLNDPLMREIASKQVLDFLNIRKTTNTRWVAKHRTLRNFFEFWTDRGYMSCLSMPQPLRRDDRPPIPFIYSRTEVRKLIQSAQQNQTNHLCAVSARTLRAVLLMLYGTGATTGEIFWLKREDLDLKRNQVSLRGDRIVQPRKIPISKDIHDLLRNYLFSEERRRVSSQNVFVSKHGGPLRGYSMRLSFARLRTRAGIIRVDGGHCRPRMRDLRQTFAVHRIASWIKEGADLNRMLPALSGYMGLAGVASTQRYLFLTPERFKRELEKLSPYKGREHWRDDPALMDFLASL
jgi:site-specific recombinase XerD